MLFENFVAIFSREGTDVEKTKDFFIEKGATSVKVSYDYISMDDSLDKCVSFFVEGMTWNQAMKTRLEMGLFGDPRLPKSHYVCIEF